jgi:hypothetical protein
MSIENISQIAIGFLTTLSIFALARKHYRIGFVLGLLSEPFWLYSTYVGGLWGMFAVVVCATGSNLYGLLNHNPKGGA